MAEASEPTITPHARFYRLHREEQLAKKKEEYNNRPDVIAKREAREVKRAQKEAERIAKKEEQKAAKKTEKEKKVQELVAIAEKTKRKIKKSEQALDLFLVSNPPAS